MLSAHLLVLAESESRGDADMPSSLEKSEKEDEKSADLPAGLKKLGIRLSKRSEKNDPSGWVDWDHDKKERWEKDLKDAMDKVMEKATKLNNFTEYDLNRALNTLETSARKGVPIKYALGLIDKALERGIKGMRLKNASKALAYGVGKEIDFDQLSNFIYEKLDEGIKEATLTIEIYKEIAIRHQQGLEQKDKIQQEKDKGEKD